MAVTPTPLEIVQGATYHLSVTWTDNGTPPAPISLTGRFALMQVRSKPGAPGDPLINLSSNPTLDRDGNTIPPAITLEPDGETGVISIRIGATQTRVLTKNCAYDLFLVKTDDITESVRLLSGPVTVDKSVTVAT
jgi:hypothetical protein